MRLDKFLSDMGIGTRSEIKKMVKAGRVSADGVRIKDPGFKVDPGSSVFVDGSRVAYAEFVYYMLNKPAGIISASNDPREQTVTDLITEDRCSDPANANGAGHVYNVMAHRSDLFPVGRLDRDTEGLLLITNDGELAHRLLSPKHHVDKVYFARVSGEVTSDDVASFSRGLALPDGLECLPAGLSVINTGLSPDGSACSEVEVTIREGKFHQIKRMFSAVGKEVIYLKRLSMGPITLDPSLQPGFWRSLKEEELQLLKSL